MYLNSLESTSLSSLYQKSLEFLLLLPMYLNSSDFFSMNSEESILGMRKLFRVEVHIFPHRQH